MPYNTILIIATLMVFLSSSVMAATTAMMIKDLPNGGEVTLSGIVEDFDSQHAFMLRDDTGTVKIDLTSMKPVVLKNGEKITVSGRVNQTILGSDVVASNVDEDKGIGQRVGEAIDSVTGQDAAGSAQLVTIKSLPNSGFVKVNGSVYSVDSAKKFTLRDTTGKVDVSIQSGEFASLSKGTEVMVIGNVDKGLLGKTILATEVHVRTNSMPVAVQ